MNSDNPSAKENQQTEQDSTKNEREVPDSFKEKLQEYKVTLEKMRDLSADLFEKQLIYISGGSLAGSVIVIDKFLNGVQNGFILVLVSWLFWGATIVINLLSHSKARTLYNRTIGEIIMDEYEKEKADERAMIVEYYNKASTYSYVIGVICFLIFFLMNMKQLNKPTLSQNNKIEIIGNQKLEKKLDSLIQQINSSKLLIMDPNSEGTRGAVPAPGPAPSNGGSKPKN